MRKRSSATAENPGGDQDNFFAGEAVAAEERFLVIDPKLETSSLGKCSVARAFDFDPSLVAPEPWSPGSIETLGVEFLLMHKPALELEYQLSFVV